MRTSHPLPDSLKRILNFIHFSIILITLIAGTGCQRSYVSEPRLQRIAEALDNPAISKEEAMPLLDSLTMISNDRLTDYEKHYKDFLSMKAADKAYIVHSSDSLYLSVKDHLSDSKELKTEILYYGGRVYSDMGNYPLALKYFQESLESMDKHTDIRLRRRTLSQTGRLLDALGLYGDALAYMEECLQIGKNTNDTLIHIYNLELAGTINLNFNQFEKAESLHSEACRLSYGRYPGEYAINKFRIGVVEYKKGNLKQALQICRETIENIDTTSIAYALPMIAQIYKRAAYPDTAYSYAMRLINGKDRLNKEIGYSVLLSDSVRHLLPEDSVRPYILAYHDLIEDRRNQNMEEQAMMQQSMYSYTIHDRERVKAERERDKLTIWFMVVIVVLLVLVIIICIYLVKKEKIRNILLGRLGKQKVITEITKKEDYTNEIEQNDSNLNNTTNPQNSIILSRENLLEEMMTHYEESNEDGEKIKVHEGIIISSPYSQLKQYIHKGKTIVYNEEIWIELEDMINRYYPDFMTRLQLLGEGRLTLHEIQTAILVKLGIRVIDIATLLGKTKGAIVSRRDSISNKIFGEKKGSKIIDNLIRSL